MTFERKAEIRERLEGVTAGRWWYDSYNTVWTGTGDGCIQVASVPDHPTTDEWTAEETQQKCVWYKKSASNAELIAHAPADLRECLDYIAELEAKVDGRT